MRFARQEAERFNHNYEDVLSANVIGTEHILLGLIKEGYGVAANVLENLNVNLKKVRIEVENMVKHGHEMAPMEQLPFTPHVKKVFEFAMEEAHNLNHNYVGTEHLLLGLLHENEDVGAQVLLNLGLKLEDVRSQVMDIIAE